MRDDLWRLFALSQEVSATLERSFNLRLVGAGVSIGGLYLIGWQVVQVLLIRKIVTQPNVGNVMWPLRTYHRLLTARGNEEQDELS